MTYGTTLCKLLQLTKVSFSFLLFAAAVSALQYRVTHLVGYKLMLTWIWHVMPSCMGSKVATAAARAARELPKMLKLCQQEDVTNQMGHPV